MHHDQLRTNRRWLAVALIAVVVFAAFAYYQQLKHGEVVTALGTIGMGGAAWGLYIVFDGYFVGLSSTGVAIAALIRIFAVKDLRPVSRVAQLMTLVAIPLSAC